MMTYVNLDTNAEHLKVGDKLTQNQIDALAQLEHEYVNGRGRIVNYDLVENVLHVFMCHAMGECVCVTQKEV